MIVHSPAQSALLCATRTSTGTLLTIPANSTWCGDLSISASVAALATGTPRITVNGSDVGPAGGTVVAQLSISGLATSTVPDSVTIGAIVVTGASSATLDFNTGGATSASATANGFTL